MMILAALPVVAQTARPRGKLLVGSNNGTSVAESTQILSRIETRRRYLPNRSRRRTITKSSQNRLRAILYNAQVEFILQRTQSRQVQTMSVKMNRHEIPDLRPRPKHLSALLQIDQAILVAVHKNRNRAQFHNRQRCSESRQGSRQHPVP